MPRVSAAPRAGGSVTLRDGRLLTYAEWGDPGGRPVVMFHGNPASRLTCPDNDGSTAAGVRLITVDRPGFGGSTPLPGRTLLGWADDYAEFHTSLGLPPCPVMGWSAGGPYALACAFALPGIVTSVGVAGSVGPIDEVHDAFDDEQHRVANLMSTDRAAAEAATEERWASVVADPISAYDGWSSNSPTSDDPDQRLYRRPDVSAAMDEWARDAARQGAAGVVSDEMVYLQPWGFSVADIACDAAVWVGDRAPADRMEADYLAATIPGATYVIYPGDGHLLTLPRWGEMLAWLH